jgi:predicted ribosome quality control (RQC) complex YloA/Tae2 family protein
MKSVTVSDENDNEFDVMIGTNAIDNWKIISLASQNDIWFHIENQPSCHVILCTNNEKISKRLITQCAVLCKENSKFKDYKKITVIYTEIKNIRNGKKEGEVYTKKLSKVIV